MSARHKLAALIAAAAVAGIVAEQSLAPPSRLVFLSVGQGDCVVFQHAGHNVVIDAGWSGNRRFIDDLRRQRVGRIDLLLLTHPDRDHIGGVEAMTAAIQVRQIGIPDHFRQHEALQTELAALGVSDRVVWIKRGASLNFGTARLDFDFAEWEPGNEDNNGSLWVRIQAGAATALLSGDAEFSAERQVLARQEWRAQVLKAGHHGSAYSTGDDLLAEADPEAVVVSCGARNPYGHPTPEVLKRIEASGAEVYRTDRQGHIIFQITPHGFERR